jgi:amino acid transporter
VEKQKTELKFSGHSLFTFMFNFEYPARFDILTAVTVKNTVFLHVTPCSVLYIYRLSGKHAASVIRAEEYAMEKNLAKVCPFTLSLYLT